MTERAKEHEIYKSKKRLPAPEITKPKNHHKPPKNWIVQTRYTAEVWEKWKNSWAGFLYKKNEWETMGKYYDYETAKVAMENDKRKYPEFNKQYEYRIIEKGEKNERNGGNKS